MNIYLFKSEEFKKYYNCTTYDINQIPLEQRVHKVLGLSYMLLGIFFEVITFY